ncbi:MAG: histone deacetylase [Pirellulaceae bacterium]|nr:histone deacetylase [Pirellulaceae bacterium]
MALLYYDEFFLKHDTGSHPESVRRLESVFSHLVASGFAGQCRQLPVRPASITELESVHSADHINHVQAFVQQGGGRIESDTMVSESSFDVALHAAGAVCDAVRQVVAGADRAALCLVRPPGHHANPQGSMGFCLFNNVAIAARLATRKLNVDRVLIVDWDVHHGNGTQDVFYADEQVGFLSIHRWPFYPGTGAADETGRGSGLGFTKNLPIEFGTQRDAYFKQFSLELGRFADELKPDLVLVSAGFDAHHLDPLGTLGLETEDFHKLTRLVLEIANSHCEGRIVSVLEGGYNTDVLPDCVAAHLTPLIDHSTKSIAD